MTTEKIITALRLARVALYHDVPGGCWATGPLTGDQIEDLVVCQGCRAIEHIDPVLDSFQPTPGFKS